MLGKLTTAVVALALGLSAALGVAACGEDRGEVQIEGGTGTAKTGTGETATGETGTAGGERTSPGTETSP
jgi:uncharacterized membrane protein